MSVILKRYAIRHIDIAPSKYFTDFEATSPGEIQAVKDAWLGRGVSIIGMQSLMFGTQGLNLFGPSGIQQQMLNHLESVCRIGQGLGATRLVFGSPKNRDATGLSTVEARSIAVRFFRELALRAMDHGVVICIEPNPAIYGCNFVLDSQSAAGLVEAVDRPSIKMQLDAGAVTAAADEPDQIVTRYRDLIGHIHLSRPNLLPLGRRDHEISAFANAVQDHLPSAIVTVETLEVDRSDNLEVVEQSLALAVDLFGNEAAK